MARAAKGRAARGKKGGGRGGATLTVWPYGVLIAVAADPGGSGPQEPLEAAAGRGSAAAVAIGEAVLEALRAAAGGRLRGLLTATVSAWPAPLGMYARDGAWVLGFLNAAYQALIHAGVAKLILTPPMPPDWGDAAPQAGRSAWLAWPLAVGLLRGEGDGAVEEELGGLEAWMAPPLRGEGLVDVKDAVVRALNVSPERVHVHPRALHRCWLPETADALKADRLDRAARVWGLEAAALAADPPCGPLERVLARWPMAVTGSIPPAQGAIPMLQVARASAHAHAVAALERLGWRVVPAPPEGIGRSRAKGRG